MVYRMSTENLQSLYEVATAELSKSPIFARALADRIARDHDLLKQLVLQIDPAVHSTAIAEYIVHIGTNNRHSDGDIWDNYRNITKIAREKAANILAQDMIASKGVETTRKLTEIEKIREDITHA